MITITNGENSHVVVPTIFPDSTSQVWKLPEWALKKQVHVNWFFENEREIIDLISLSNLVDFTVLNIPYLPYARQDKDINNSSTFNLKVLRDLLWLIDEDLHVRTFDVHNDYQTKLLFDNFTNVEAIDFHKDVLKKVKPTYIVFPDNGAWFRYPHLYSHPYIIFEKNRNSLSGDITVHKMVNVEPIKSGDSFLIIDDLVDGGATFISVAKALREVEENIGIDLCVSHGLFSQGKEILHKAGIQNIYTTNSLIRNKDGYKVV